MPLKYQYSYSFDANGNALTRNGQSIVWNKYNYPTELNGSATEKVTLSYDANNARWKQVSVKDGVTETTHYIGGLLEKVLDGTGVTRFRYYLYSQSNTAAIAVMSRNSDGSNGTYYVLDDHQQSPAAIRDANGTAVVNESFSAYGVRRNWQTWQGAAETVELTTSATITRQGYTWQTALGNMGLNHMNGRVQDAITGIFLSADPYISEPTNTQNYNRYSYVYNNPLSLTDPSGFWACEWNIGFTFAGTTGSGIFGGNGIEQSAASGGLDMGLYDNKGVKLADYNKNSAVGNWYKITKGSYTSDTDGSNQFPIYPYWVYIQNPLYSGNNSNPPLTGGSVNSETTSTHTLNHTLKTGLCRFGNSLAGWSESMADFGLKLELGGAAIAIYGALTGPGEAAIGPFGLTVMAFGGVINTWVAGSLQVASGVFQGDKRNVVNGTFAIGGSVAFGKMTNWLAGGTSANKTVSQRKINRSAKLSETYSGAFYDAYSSFGQGPISVDCK